MVSLLVLTGCSMGQSGTETGNGSGIVDGATGSGPVWDAGNIISDEVFYNSNALTSIGAVQQVLDEIGADCTTGGCLRTATYATPSQSSKWCAPYSGNAAETFASMLFKMAKACGINPQVAIVMIQKESGGLQKDPPPAALTGFGCPDTGPGGSANCNSAVSGVFAQTWGLFQAFAKLRKDSSYVNYIEGQTHDILWNVEETGCGAAPVKVANRATATLYTYTPYQPNAAAQAAAPGQTGDRCSAYGNKNFFQLFQKYFGSTGGGKTPGAGGDGDTVVANGVNVTIPSNQFVTEALRGKTIKAPTEGIAKGLASGFSKLGLPYVWGGGGDGAPENNGCARGGGAYNSCGSEIGFDCSGLTAWVLVKGGYGSPGGESGTQRSTGTDVSWDQGLPGDIVGFDGHVAIYLGTISGTRYILEASTQGVPIHVVPLTRSDYDSSLHRHWTGSVA